MPSHKQIADKLTEWFLIWAAPDPDFMRDLHAAIGQQQGSGGVGEFAKQILDQQLWLSWDTRGIGFEKTQYTADQTPKYKELNELMRQYQTALTANLRRRWREAYDSLIAKLESIHLAYDENGTSRSGTGSLRTHTCSTRWSRCCATSAPTGRPPRSASSNCWRT